MSLSSWLLPSFMVVSVLIQTGCGRRYVSPEEVKIKTTVYASGEIETRDQVVIKSEVSGYIADLNKYEGDIVSRGETLATISNKPLESKISELNKRIASIESKLKEGSAFQAELAAKIKSAQAELDRERSRKERLLSLKDSGGISNDEIDEASRRSAVAEERLTSVTKQTETVIQDLRFELDALKAQRDGLLEELAKLRIKSPLDGLVLKRFVKLGDYVNANSGSNQLFIVGNINDLDTILYVDEEFSPRISVGQNVLVYLDSYPDKTFQGQIYSVEPYIDPTSRTMRVRCRINYSDRVFPGSVVEATIIVEEKTAYRIPKKVLKKGKIRVLREQKVIEIEPKFQDYEGDQITVLEGLLPNDKILAP